nr:hypothetical protein [Helicobacter pylori]
MFFQSCFLSDFIIDCLFLFRGLFFILLFFYSFILLFFYSFILLFFILYSLFFILYSLFFILYSLFRRCCFFISFVFNFFGLG